MVTIKECRLVAGVGGEGGKGRGRRVPGETSQTKPVTAWAGGQKVESRRRVNVKHQQASRTSALSGRLLHGSIGASQCEIDCSKGGCTNRVYHENASHVCATIDSGPCFEPRMVPHPRPLALSLGNCGIFRASPRTFRHECSARQTSEIDACPIRCYAAAFWGRM